MGKSHGFSNSVIAATIMVAFFSPDQAIGTGGVVNFGRKTGTLKFKKISSELRAAKDDIRAMLNIWRQTLGPQ